MINDIVRSEVDVAARLRPVLLRLGRELRREVHQFGVTGGQALLLGAISTNPGLSLKDLAESERMSPAAMSGHVDRLVKAGLVFRTRDQVDRRRIGLTLTPDGVALLARVRSQRTAWLAQRLRRLQPEQVRAIDEATDAIAALLEETV